MGNDLISCHGFWKNGSADLSVLVTETDSGWKWGPHCTIGPFPFQGRSRRPSHGVHLWWGSNNTEVVLHTINGGIHECSGRFRLLILYGGQPHARQSA
ncbi:MAG: hypothetical protein ACXV5H_09500 [Halobacteriota archaeon]